MIQGNPSINFQKQESIINEHALYFCLRDFIVDSESLYSPRRYGEITMVESLYSLCAWWLQPSALPKARAWGLRSDPLFLERKMKMIKILRIPREISDYTGKSKYKIVGMRGLILAPTHRHLVNPPIAITNVHSIAYSTTAKIRDQKCLVRMSWSFTINPTDYGYQKRWSEGYFWYFCNLKDCRNTSKRKLYFLPFFLMTSTNTRHERHNLH